MSFKTFFKLAQEDIVQNEPVVPTPVPTGDPQLDTPPPSPAVQTVNQPITPEMNVPTIPTKLVPWTDKRTKRIKGYYLNIMKIPAQSELGKALTNLGYKFKFGKFNKAISLGNAQTIEPELDEIATRFNIIFDRSGLDDIRTVFDIRDTESDVGTGTERELEVVEEETSKKVKMIMEKGGREKEQLSKDTIKKYMEELSSSVDEAFKQDFLQRFLDFSSNMYNYSFFNTILIWFQNPESSKVQSKTNWAEMGRQPKKTIEKIEDETGEIKQIPNEPLTILRPEQKKIYHSSVAIFINALQAYPFQNANMAQQNERNDFLRYSKLNKFPYNDFLFALVVKYKATTIPKIIEAANTLKQKAVKWKNVYYDSAGRVTNFVDAPTYDYSQTEPIPGVPVDKVYDPNTVQWQSEHNVEDESIGQLARAAIAFGNSKGVKIDIEADTGRAGGWSRGSKVAVSRMSKGLRQFSTIIHELTHSFLHFDEKDTMIVGDRTIAETEAESTVYVVLRHYGFNELQFASNYLALHTKGDTKRIFEGFENVSKTAKQIIQGIEKFKVEKAAKNWFQRLKLANAIPTIIDEYC
jgi:hypothetical protein